MSPVFGRVLGLVVLGACGVVVGCQRPKDEASRGAATSVASGVVQVAALPSRGERFTEGGMLAEGGRYLDEPGFRRDVVTRCFENPSNTYSRQRLTNYALGTRGWDLLPEWTPRSVPMTKDRAMALQRGEPIVLADDTPAIWDGKRPGTMAEWVRLGERVFFLYPLRVEVFFEHAVKNPEVAKMAGVQSTEAGDYPGAVEFINDSGKASVGLTCAACHTRVVKGALHVGEARREFDYGRLRLRYHQDTKTTVDPELARRMATWGPGRADVTEDEAEDPVAIPDMWGLKSQTALTQAGTLKHEGPTVLAIRQETQLLHSNHQRVRPPRELAWALAMFIYSLEPPLAVAPAVVPGRVAEGKQLFERTCKSCHSNDVYGGPPVEVARVGTDRALASGGARGTGRYRPPALLRVRDAGPYLHHGAVRSLDELLGPERLGASYAAGTLGPGPVPGHTFGTDLPLSERGAIVAFLRTL